MRGKRNLSLSVNSVASLPFGVLSPSEVTTDRIKCRRFMMFIRFNENVYIYKIQQQNRVD